MTDTIIKLMSRHLEQLHLEMSSYKNESDIWLRQGEISNTAGNLCLHLCGNLQHFIGAVLGDTGYVRKREDEFGLKDVPLANLLTDIDKTTDVITATLSKMNDTELQENYPIEVLGQPMTIEFFLIHLTSHLGYHLGQINYHRRLLSA